MDDSTTLRNEWTDIFRSDTPVHLALMGSITAGCFQGWLKDRVSGWLPYVLSDGLYIAAVVLWFATIVVFRQPLVRTRGRSQFPTILLALVALPLLYLLAPGTPLPIELAGLRAWSAFPIAFLIALTVIRSPGQARAYVGLVLILCVITGIYGIMQYIRGPQEALEAPLATLRHGSTVFYRVETTGETDFRAFSTFTFPAPFAAMMVFGLLLGAGTIANRLRPGVERLLLIAIAPLLFVAMSLTGTRAALLILLIGMLVLLWLRGVTWGQLLMVVLLVVALHVATVLTSGRVASRLSTAVQEGALWTYVTTPVRTALAALKDTWLGAGLGRSGVGVPFFMMARMPRDFFVYGDGDIGRAAAEMGLMGLLWLVMLVAGLLPEMLRAARRLAQSPERDLGLGIGALVLSEALVILIGSPLSSTPHAIIWWFLFGAAVRLSQDLPDPEPAAPEPEAEGLGVRG
jgi:O-antigen ligase